MPLPEARLVIKEGVMRVAISGCRKGRKRNGMVGGNSRDEEIARMWKLGYKMFTIARRLGMKENGVEGAIQRLGLPHKRRK